MSCSSNMKVLLIFTFRLQIWKRGFEEIFEISQSMKSFCDHYQNLLISILCFIILRLVETFIQIYTKSINFKIPSKPLSPSTKIECSGRIVVKTCNCLNFSKLNVELVDNVNISVAAIWVLTNGNGTIVVVVASNPAIETLLIIKIS